MKNKTLWIFASLIIVLVLSACSGGVATPVTPSQRLINVTGTGTVYLTPDVAYINIGVRSQAEQVTEALTQNTNQAQAVASALKELGVDALDIQTSAFNVYPQQEYGPMGEVVRTVYVVENTVYVTVRDLNKLGQMLDVVVRSGANTINGIQFDILDKSAAESQARKLAVENAKKQAQELADAAGVKLGPLVAVNVYMTSPPSPFFTGKGGVRMDMAQSVPVSAGQLVMSMDASLSYEIK